MIHGNIQNIQIKILQDNFLYPMTCVALKSSHNSSAKWGGGVFSRLMRQLDRLISTVCHAPTCTWAEKLWSYVNNAMHHHTHHYLCFHARHISFVHTLMYLISLVYMYFIHVTVYMYLIHSQDACDCCLVYEYVVYLNHWCLVTGIYTLIIFTGSHPFYMHTFYKFQAHLCQILLNAWLFLGCT